MKPKSLILIISLIIVTVMAGVQVQIAFRKNMAWSAFLHAMSNESLITTQPNAMRAFLAFLPSAELSGVGQLYDVPDTHSASRFSVKQMMFRGEAARARGQWPEALRWYRELSRLDTFSLSAYELGAWRQRLDSSGAILISDFNSLDGWSLQSEPRNVTYQAADGIVTLYIDHSTQVRKKAALSIFPNPLGEPLAYHRLLEVVLKADQNAHFTLETVIDGQRCRLIAYRRGSGQWETIRVPLEGEILKEIKLIFNEPGNTSIQKEPVEIELNRVRLLLQDETLPK